MECTKLVAAMSLAGLLVACGGGGGGDAGGSAAPTTPPPAGARVTLSGVAAATGLLENADATVHAIADDGSVAAAPLDRQPLGSAGAYSLAFDATPGAAYLVRVASRDDGSTRQLDDAPGAVAQALPAGLTLRAPVRVPAAASGSVALQATVTPLSEMAVTAALRGGGLSAANLAQGVTTMFALLGFNPLAAPAPSTRATAAIPAQQLGVVLKAAAQIAADGALGCATGTPGERTRCVVDALAASSSLASIKLQNGATDVSAVLAAAVDTVLADPAVAAAVPASTLITVKTSLACRADACAAPPASGAATSLGIAAARHMFSEIQSDFRTLFSRGLSATSGGAANAQAWKFSQAVRDIQVPVDVMAKDLGVLLMAADFYNDYKAGRDRSNIRLRGPGIVATDTPSTTLDAFEGTRCGVYQADGVTLATTSGNAVSVGCGAVYFVRLDRATNVVREWRHGFTVTPNADGSFGYTTRARLRTSPCVAPACTNNNVALQTDFYAGTLTPTLDAAGGITAFTLAGKLPGAFAEGGTTLVNDHHEWSMQGTRTLASGSETVAISGVIRAYDAGAALRSTLQLRDGSRLELTPVTAGGARPGSAAPAGGNQPSAGVLDLRWTAAAAEFDGSLSLTDSAWDASGTRLVPTKAALAGSLRTVTGGVASEFLAGSFSGSTTGWSTHDARLPLSAGNDFGASFTFVGAASAPNRPRLEISIGAAGRASASNADSMTLQYRSFVAGVPRITIAASATPAAGGETTFVLTEAGADLRMTLAPGDAPADLLHAGTKIGTLDRRSGVLTFVDGSFMSLATGV